MHSGFTAFCLIAQGGLLNPWNRLAAFLQKLSRISAKLNPAVVFVMAIEPLYR
jgi:hypothetical protein